MRKIFILIIVVALLFVYFQPNLMELFRIEERSVYNSYEEIPRAERDVLASLIIGYGGVKIPEAVGVIGGHSTTGYSGDVIRYHDLGSSWFAEMLFKIDFGPVLPENYELATFYLVLTDAGGRKLVTPGTTSGASWVEYGYVGEPMTIKQIGYDNWDWKTVTYSSKPAYIAHVGDVVGDDLGNKEWAFLLDKNFIQQQLMSGNTKIGLALSIPKSSYWHEKYVWSLNSGSPPYIKVVGFGGQWCMSSRTLLNGLTLYQTNSLGNQITKIRPKLTADIPPDIVPGTTVDIPVAVGNLSLIEDIAITAQIYSPTGANLGTWSGFTPTITIPNFPSNAKTIHFKATREGDTTTAQYDLEVEALGLEFVGFTDAFRYRTDTTVDLAFTGINHMETATVVIKSLNTGLTLATYTQMMPTIDITNPIAYGPCSIEATATYQGVKYSTGKKSITFQGPAVNYEYYNYKPVQYAPTVEFDIKLTDFVTGAPITSQITDLSSKCSLTSGSATSPVPQSLGGGIYRITSTISGSGTFTGKMYFKYMGVSEETTNPMSINIGLDIISISMTEIPAYAIKGEPFTGYITFTNSVGSAFDPTTMSMRIKLPSGSYEESCPLTKVSTGRYSFTYTPAELEKYTFEVTASAPGIASNVGTTTMLVYPPDPAPIQGDVWLNFIINNLWIIALIFVGIIIFLWRFR